MKLLSSQTTTKETKKFQLFSDFPNINLEVISENNKIKNAKLKGKGCFFLKNLFFCNIFKNISYN